jgi:hypothetical protein
MIRTSACFLFYFFGNYYHDDQIAAISDSKFPGEALERYKRGTQTKISSFLKHSINNAKYVGYLKLKYLKTNVLWK